MEYTGDGGDDHRFGTDRGGGVMTGIEQRGGGIHRCGTDRDAEGEGV
jgi:hypothetical protein